jgi:hypothetical protein
MFFFICSRLDKNISNSDLFLNEQNKFIIYKKLINQNYKNYDTHIFTKAQNIYHKLNNLILKYKLNKYKPNNETDMYLDKINYNSKNTIQLIIDNKKFLFTTKDINHLINASLLNMNSGFILKPGKIRNPYTNNVIELHNLYNIYIKLKTLNSINLTYYQYYKKNFDIKLLQIESKELLLYESYKYKINNSSDKYLYESIIQMFDSVDKYFNIMYFLQNNEKILVNKYKKLLIYYYLYISKNSSISTSIINRITLVKKLFETIDNSKIYSVIKNDEIFKIINIDYYSDEAILDYLHLLTPSSRNNNTNNNTTSELPTTQVRQTNDSTSNQETTQTSITTISNNEINSELTSQTNVEINRKNNKNFLLKKYLKNIKHKKVIIYLVIFIDILAKIAFILFKSMQIIVITNGFFMIYNEYKLLK